MEGKVLIFELPVDKNGQMLISYKIVQEAVKTIRDCVGTDYEVIAALCTAVLSNDYKNVKQIPILSMNDLNEILENYKKD